MDTLELQPDPSGIESFVHRNTKTEISNFEGSFRPCLFSHIASSSSSFESSFEDSEANLSEILKEERPLSKSYKPSSVLKASFLTEERNSPSFKEFEGGNGKDANMEFRNFKGLENDVYRNLDPKDSERFKRKQENKEFFNANMFKNEGFNEVVHVSSIKELPKTEISEKEVQNSKFLTLIDIITQKDEEIKEYRSQISAKDKELNDYIMKLKNSGAIIQELEKEKEKFNETCQRFMEKLEKCEAQLAKEKLINNDLQKELNKLSNKATKEDRVRKMPDEITWKESRVKEISAENDYLKQELQKRPSIAQHQASLSRIEELEGLLSKRPTHKHGSSHIVKGLLDYLKLENPSDILACIKDLKSPKADCKLLHRLSSLIQDCVPPGTFKRGPSHREIWKFIRNVMESYILLKKNDSNMLISKLQGCLGIGENEDLFEEVMKIYKSLNFMELVFDKIKAKVGLSPHASIEEVEAAFGEI